MERTTSLGLSRRTVERIRARLLRQAGLFDDPEAYTAGVLDTLDALALRGAPVCRPGEPEVVDVRDADTQRGRDEHGDEPDHTRPVP